MEKFVRSALNEGFAIIQCLLLLFFFIEVGLFGFQTKMTHFLQNLFGTKSWMFYLILVKPFK